MKIGQIWTRKIAFSSSTISLPLLNPYEPPQVECLEPEPAAVTEDEADYEYLTWNLMAAIAALAVIVSTFFLIPWLAGAAG